MFWSTQLYNAFWEYADTPKTHWRVHDVYKRQNSSKLALILTLCYRPYTHPFNPLYPCEIIMKQLNLISCMTETTCVY